MSNNIHPTGLLKKMKKLRQQKLDAYKSKNPFFGDYFTQLAQLGEMYGLCYEDALAKAYEPDDEHDGFIPQLLTENEKFFYDDSRELYNRYHNEQDTQKAKWAAQFLIIMHIARRGKILHPDNARIALTRYGDNGEKIIAMLDDSHLAQELHKKYHVTLMNKKLVDSVIEKIEDLSRYADPKYSPRACRKLQQCKNFLKKFHKATLNIEKSK